MHQFSYSLGHPDKMLSPLKHELRLAVTESANGPYHQLVMMKHASIFINDSTEASRVLNTVPSKGAIYDLFRYNKDIPDTIASDGEAYNLRSPHLTDPLRNLTIDSESLSPILQQFGDALHKHTLSGESIDLMKLLTLLSLDIISLHIFNYPLNAISGSEEGEQLYTCLITLIEYQSSQGIYANTKARKIPPEELKLVANHWRIFISKIYNNFHEKWVSDTTHNSDTFGSALINLMKNNDKFGESEAIAEIHQVLRHGSENICATLAWSFYALFKNPNVSIYSVVYEWYMLYLGLLCICVSGICYICICICYIKIPL